MALTKITSKVIEDGAITSSKLAIGAVDSQVQSYLTTNAYATSTDLSTAVSALVDSAPGTLDTLNELAAALGDDPNFATTITTNLAGKASLTGATFTGAVTATSFIGDGSSLTGIDSLPTQTNNSGKYLTTDGTTASWSAIPTTFAFYKSDGTNDSINLTSAQELPFFDASGASKDIALVA